MSQLISIQARLLRVLSILTLRLARGTRSARDDRGDVPGWVLVTVMSAGIVMAIWGLAEGQLSSMLSTALDSVK